MITFFFSVNGERTCRKVLGLQGYGPRNMGIYTRLPSCLQRGRTYSVSVVKEIMNQIILSEIVFTLLDHASCSVGCYFVCHRSPSSPLIQETLWNGRHLRSSD